MKDLPPIFANNQIAVLDGFAERDESTAEQYFGDPVRSSLTVRVSALTKKILHLRLDDRIYTFTEALGKVTCVTEQPPLSLKLTAFEPSRTVSIHLADGALELVDEASNRSVVQIGKAIQHRLNEAPRPTPKPAKQTSQGYRVKVGRWA